MATPFPDVKPWPETNPRAVAGHNRPPVEEQGVSDFNEKVDRHDGLRARIVALCDSATRAAATDDDSAGRCAELIRQMAAAEKVVEGERVATKQPYLDAGRKIDDAARTLLAPLVADKAKVRAIAESYMREKAAREAAERRAAAEATAAEAEGRAPDAAIMEAPAAAAATAPEATPTQVRSDFGAVASARKVKIAEVVDWNKAFRAVRTVPAVQEAIHKAVNALVRAGQNEIPGVEIREDIGLSVR